VLTVVEIGVIFERNHAKIYTFFILNSEKRRDRRK